MSRTIDYRQNAGLPSTMPKYLSDSLGPSFYGSWASGVVVNIAYDNLPPEPDVMGRVYHDVAGFGENLFFTFLTPQNLNGYYLDFWMRYTGPATNISQTVFDVLGANTVRFIAGPAAWTKYTVKIPDSLAVFSGWLNLDSPTRMAVRVIELNWYADPGAGAWRLEVAGVNPRRL